ncbi:MAG: methyltransferase domain-containing protein [Desulfovibrionaceae bacterium]|nr:methyltransferase domain-containing protein [Desulfovibrionaceae bacterium]MBF0512564.1 methyltransferase domain-containing protein [Desulfovibrionaceae bacterium]
METFFSGTGPTYDHIVGLTTLGQDARWKKLILKQIPAGSTRIVDQACGTGILTFQIAKRFPLARVIGVELRDEYLSLARRKAKHAGLTNVEFILGRAEDVVLEPGVDCIVSSYLAKYADLPVLIAGAKAMLRPGGILAMHDFAPTRDRSFGGLGAFYFILLRAYSRWRYPEWETIFRELPELMLRTNWPGHLAGQLASQGFADIRTQALSGNIAALVTARKE